MTPWERDPIALPNLPRLTLLFGAHEHAVKRCAFFSTPLTATHARGLQCVLKFATSHYSKVFSVDVNAGNSSQLLVVMSILFSIGSDLGSSFIG